MTTLRAESVDSQGPPCRDDRSVANSAGPTTKRIGKDEDSQCHDQSVNLHFSRSSLAARPLSRFFVRLADLQSPLASFAHQSSTTTLEDDERGGGYELRDEGWWLNVKLACQFCGLWMDLLWAASLTHEACSVGQDWLPKLLWFAPFEF